jgi:hypothetical protein
MFSIKEMYVHMQQSSDQFDFDGVFAFEPGLPDFSWYNIPKQEKYTK